MKKTLIRVVTGVFLIGLVLLAESHLPFVAVELWEEGVGLCWGVVYLGQAETVGKGQCLCIDTCSTDDIDVLGPPVPL